MRIAPEVGLGYTLATGRLFARMADFHEFAEGLLGRPVWTHEFASEELWALLRKAYEERQAAELGADIDVGGDPVG